MDNLKVELFKKLDIIEAKSDSKLVDFYQLDFLKKCLDRIFIFSSKCNECKKNMRKMDEILTELIQKKDSDIDKKVLNDYKNELEDVIIHLRENHGLVAKGYYISLCTSVGISLGVIAGLLVENLAVGIVFGMLAGLSIGSIIESKSKKKGQTI